MDFAFVWPTYDFIFIFIFIYIRTVMRSQQDTSEKGVVELVVTLLDGLAGKVLTLREDSM